ncbi:putative glutathione S-transferase [Cavenderia fasciculata]|uniref:Glutathione S-transferase n=1 Tax=Cavenderia fasciculata TaxID=261658 RepID=F4PLG4_CACFS|nr:putative glutathione S-transferase [Cavenderia fasciculata]EGG23386.1 putative glutathione S-transferase [Cavenderia fasciculata]|eukprot:XP_004361237.1 putative glutathione S-transferase [Cavenderia fasciculata]
MGLGAINIICISFFTLEVDRQINTNTNINIKMSTATTFIDIPTNHIQTRRPQSSFKHCITKGGEFPPEQGRYLLIISLACPWAHRTYIVRKLKGLESTIDLEIVDYFLGNGGWHFSDRHGSTPDVNGFKFLKEYYIKSDPEFSGRITVPVLWDKKTNQIVNNESSEIIRMFNKEFDEFSSRPGLTFYPDQHAQAIDEVNSWIYDNINNGVYKCGFASGQEGYDKAFENLFIHLDKVEEILSKQAFLVGSTFTEADIRLFTTLIRFDPVYYVHFKTNKRMIKDYPHISKYLRRIYQHSDIKSTVDMFHIKHHYYESHRQINPLGIVPVGPELDYLESPIEEKLIF